MIYFLNQGVAAIAAPIHSGKDGARGGGPTGDLRFDQRNSELTAVVDLTLFDAGDATDAVYAKSGSEGAILGLPSSPNPRRSRKV